MQEQEGLSRETEDRHQSEMKSIQSLPPAPLVVVSPLAPDPVCTSSREPRPDALKCDSSSRSPTMAPRRPGNQPAPAPSEHVVTGPTSALTSFLREQGITHRANRQPNPRPAVVVEVDEEPAVPAEDKEVEVETEGTAENGNAVASGSGSAKRPAQTVKQKAAEMKKRKLADKAAFDLKNSSPAPGPAKKYDDRALGAISQCGECGSTFLCHLEMWRS